MFSSTPPGMLLFLYILTWVSTFLIAHSFNLFSLFTQIATIVPFIPLAFKASKNKYVFPVLLISLALVCIAIFGSFELVSFASFNLTLLLVGSLLISHNNSNHRYTTIGSLSSHVSSRLPSILKYFPIITLIVSRCIQSSIEANGSVVVASAAAWFYYYAYIYGIPKQQKSRRSLAFQLLYTYFYLMAIFVITTSRTIIPAFPFFTLLLLFVYRHEEYLGKIFLSIQKLIALSLIIFVAIFYFAMPLAVTLSLSQSSYDNASDRTTSFRHIADIISVSKMLRGSYADINGQQDSFNELYRISIVPFYVGDYIISHPLGSLFRQQPNVSEGSVSTVPSKSSSPTDKSSNLLHSAFLTIIFQFGLTGYLAVLFLLILCLYSLTSFFTAYCPTLLILSWLFVTSNFSSGSLFGMQGLIFPPLLFFILSCCSKSQALPLRF